LVIPGEPKVRRSEAGIFAWLKFSPDGWTIRGIRLPIRHLSDYHVLARQFCPLECNITDDHLAITLI
jgi:hypothetical protein